MDQGHRNCNGRGCGFTYIDLLVVMLIVCFLSGMVFSAGALTKARETLRRVNCARNLKMIGTAIMLYGNENKGAYPRVVYKVGENVTQYTGVECKDPFHGEGTPKANDITAAMYLLLRMQDIKPEAFICPSTDAKPIQFEKGKLVNDYSNFKSEEQLSYSMASVYPDANATNRGYKMNATTGAEIAVVADMNPGQVGEFDATPKKGPKDESAEMAMMRKGNSMNHRGMGQNVLYGDGHVEFQQTPFCGQNRDNIYTVSCSDDGKKTTSETISGSPRWSGDSVLLPAATANPHKQTAEEEGREVIDEKALAAELDTLRVNVAKESLHSIKGALAIFEFDNGRYPTTAEGLDALVSQPAGLTNWHGPYVDAEMVQKDLWGHPFVYRYPGKKNPKGFDLFSLGADGRESADDIGE